MSEFKDKLIDKYADQMQGWFALAFRKRILNGRPPLMADISNRTYPYTDLVKMYSAGVVNGIDMVIKEHQDEND